jgi:glycosyltransferase involved in cell wall biosynthesis
MGTAHADGGAPAWVFSNHGLRHSGGIERYLLTLVRGLHARGVRPTVVVKKIDRTIEEAAWVDAVTVSMAGIPGKLRDLWFDHRVHALKARRGWFPLIALNQTAAADIAISGSNHPAHLAAMGAPTRLSDRWKIGLERAHLERSRVVVAHSQLLARQAIEHYEIDAAKVRVLYPPVDTARFAPVDAQQRAGLRARLGLPADRAVFLLASTGHARKGLDLAVNALGRGDRPALLVVAGRPPEVQAPNLRYLGYRTDIEDVYRAVDCTLLVSRYEPFGLVGIESVLCGTPVIVARQGVGCAEVMRPPGALPFDAGQPGSLDAAIDSAIERWRGGTLRLDDPRAVLAYDPGVEPHLDGLRDCIAAAFAVR